LNRKIDVPGVPFTYTSFQKRFFSRPPCLFELTCELRTLDSSSDCLLLRKIRSSGSGTIGDGTGGGGPGAVGCGTGLAELAMEECIRRTSRLLNLMYRLDIPRIGRIGVIFNPIS
jgi:hypothetical protein